MLREKSGASNHTGEPNALDRMSVLAITAHMAVFGFLMLFTLCATISCSSADHSSIPYVIATNSQVVPVAQSTAIHQKRAREAFIFAPGQDASTDICTADFCIIQGQTMVGLPFTPLACTPVPANDEDCSEYTANVSAAPVNSPGGLNFSISPSGLLNGNVSRQWNMGADSATPTGIYEVAVTYEDYQNPGPGLINNRDQSYSVQVLCSLSLGNCSTLPGPGADVQCIYETTLASEGTVSFAKKRESRSQKIRQRQDVIAQPTTAPSSVIVANPCSPLPSLPSPPPAPQAALPAITMVIGQTADFELTDSADASQGALTWNITPTDVTQPVYSISNPVTSEAPHNNSLIFPTSGNTPTGLYTIAVSVTSQITGLTSATTIIQLTDLIPVQVSQLTDIVDPSDNDSIPYVFQSPYLTPSIESIYGEGLAALNDGESNVTPVDQDGYDSMFSKRAKSRTISRPRRFDGPVPNEPASGQYSTPTICSFQAKADPLAGQISLSNISYSCPGGIPSKLAYKGLQEFEWVG